MEDQARKQAVLFLKKKNQKNFFPFAARLVQGPVNASSARHLRRRARAKQTILVSQQTRLAASNCRASSRTEAKWRKVFCFFFPKKKNLPTTCLPSKALP
jgi:hypothetical protein